MTFGGQACIPPLPPPICAPDQSNFQSNQVKNLHEHWSQNKEVGIQVFENLPIASSSNTADNSTAANDDEEFSSSPQQDDDPLIDFSNQGSILPSSSVDCPSSPLNLPEPLSSHSSFPLSRETPPDDTHGAQGDELLDVLLSLGDDHHEANETTEEPRPAATDSANELTITTLNIKMPPKLNMRGRPKGSDKTNVIGLPKTKRTGKATLTRFVDMKNSEKEKRVLLWCVGEMVSKSCLENGEKITCDKIDPTEISAQSYSKFVTIETISYWFEEDAWTRFQNFYTAKSSALKDRCSCCSKPDSDGMIVCDHCLQNFHESCAKLKKTSKKRQQWFCNACKVEFKSSEQKDNS